MRQRSPCAVCEYGHKGKNKPRCRDCEKRVAYVASLADAPECRDDPSYQMSYSTPEIFRSQMPQAPISSWELMAF